MSAETDLYEEEKQVVEKIHESRGRIEHELSKVIVGQKEVSQQLLISLFAGGHCLITGAPGLAKTLLVRSIAQVFKLKFQRIQFTPDLMPADITGTEILEESGDGRRKMVFVKGPIFANVILADEINRTPPKTQAALLEAMQEHQVTSERSTYPLPSPFVVLATENPIELEGTYPLPEAQVDRFLLRLRIGYPTVEEETAILARRRARRTDPVEVPSVSNAAEFLGLQAAVEDVEVAAPIADYVIGLVRATRDDPRAEVGVSPRGSLALQKAVRARALLQGRDFVLPDDVKALAEPALAHRIVVKPEPWIRGVRGDAIVRAAIDRTPVPKAA
ncbi:MAG TPA: MoxR family ATPase [Thermoplasmata archaeon]|nr:MoxR family ATPase [Thermoplasmata archaeon]